MSEIYLAEKQQLQSQNELLDTYNEELEAIEGSLSDLATLAQRKQIKRVASSTQQQTIEADEGYNGLQSVTIDPPNLVTKSISANGSYSASQDEADGYSEVAVNVQPSLVEKNITKNGTYTASDDGVQGYSKAIVNLPFQVGFAHPSIFPYDIQPDEGYAGFSYVNVVPVTSSIDTNIQPENIKQGVDILGVEGTLKPIPEPVEEKFINFIDYDGTLLYSWTEEELQEATELPTLPTREGYTYQEWNWDLANLKSSPVSVLVGAVVTPSAAPESCAFKLILFENDPTTVTLTCKLIRCSCEINWGDGATDTLTSSSYGGESLSLTHSYNAVSFPSIYNVYIKYIKSYSQDGSVGLVIGWINDLFKQRLLEVFFGKNVFPLNSSCLGFKSLRIVGLSKEYNGSYSYNVFGGCAALKHLIIPKNVLFLGSVEFQRCYGMKQISLPDTFVGLNDMGTLSETAINNIALPIGMTTIGRSALQSDICLRYVLIPESVITVADLAFSECSNLSVVDLSSYDDPAIIPSLESINAFRNIATGATFYVRNQSLLDAFSAATNWSTYADRFQIKEA